AGTASVLLSMRPGLSTPASLGPALVPIVASLADEDRPRERLPTEGSELSASRNADSRSSKATCNSLASAAVSWFLKLLGPTAPKRRGCPPRAGLRSRPKAGHAGQPIDLGKGPAGSAASPLRGFGRRHDCGAGPAIRPLVDQRRGPGPASLRPLRSLPSQALPSPMWRRRPQARQDRPPRQCPRA